jgi:hypothetical protein
MQKLPILPIAHVVDQDAIRAWAVDAITQKQITRRQFSAVTLLAGRHVPCSVELRQRSPKSVLYLWIDGTLEYRIGQRAEVYGGHPQSITL